MILSISYKLKLLCYKFKRVAQKAKVSLPVYSQISPCMVAGKRSVFVTFNKEISNKEFCQFQFTDCRPGYSCTSRSILSFLLPVGVR